MKQFKFSIHFVPAAELKNRSEAVEALAELEHQSLVDQLLPAVADDLHMFPVRSIADAVEQVMRIELQVAVKTTLGGQSGQKAAIPFHLLIIWRNRENLGK